MIRQAHTYLVGALSGVTLIGIAIGVFIVLVSAQVFHEFPLADAGSHAERPGVAEARALTAPGQGAAKATGATATTASPRTTKTHGTGAATTGTTARSRAGGGNVQRAAGPTTSVEAASPTTGGGESSSSGGNSGSSTAPSHGHSPSSPSF